jgi:predicted TIM-barrel fold metal-dependent hydrolase
MICDSALSREFVQQGRSASCPVIDVHVHLGPIYTGWMPKWSIDGLIDTMDQAGVQVSVLCPHSALFSPDIGNDETIEAARHHPGRIRGYLGINPAHPRNIEKDLANFDRNRDLLAGLKMLASYHRVLMDDDAYRPAWEFADAHRLPVLCHTWGSDGSEQSLRNVATRHPNARIIMAHALHGLWDDAIDMAKQFENVHLDLCAVLDDRGPVEKFVKAGLVKRLLFGTDNPWFHPHQGIGALLSADLTDEDRQDILHRNARRLFGATIP